MEREEEREKSGGEGVLGTQRETYVDRGRGGGQGAGRWRWGCARGGVRAEFLLKAQKLCERGDGARDYHEVCNWASFFFFFFFLSLSLCFICFPQLFLWTRSLGLCSPQRLTEEVAKDRGSKLQNTQIPSQ